MAPIRKTEKSKTRGVQVRSSRVYTIESDTESLLEQEDGFAEMRQIAKTNKAGKAGRAKNTPNVVRGKTAKTAKSRQAFVEDDTENSDKDIEGAIQRRGQIRPETQKSLYNLEMASIDFLSHVKSVDDVNALLQTCNSERMISIEEKVGSAAKLLRSRRGPATATTPKAGTLQSLDQHFVLRDVGQTVLLLAPVEIFKATKSIKNKTFGFVRKAGEYWPIMCAISGITNIVPPHEKLLDSEFWSNEVFRFGTFGDVNFRSSPYEAHQGLQRGRHFSGHVEPKLMLFYACRILCKVLGKEIPVSVRKQVAHLGRINGREMRPRLVAEIVLDREPCLNCKVFQEHIEDITGIKFSFIVCPKLGRVKLEKDQYGNQVFPLCAEEYVPSDDSETEAGESTIQVVLPQRIPASTQISRPHKSYKSSKFQIKTKISMAPMAAPKRSRQLAIDYNFGQEEAQDDHDTRSLYEPVARRSKNELPSTPKIRSTRNSSPLSPDESYEFGYENLTRAKKRKLDVARFYASPVSAKKSRTTWH